MAKAIILKDCAGCPYRDHSGAFGSVSFIPVCITNSNELPYRIALSPTMGKIAIPTLEIPKWCPLEDYEEK